MSKIINWIFSKTKAGRVVDGHKTKFGFAIWTLGVLLTWALKGASLFPGYEVFNTIAFGLEGLLSGVNDIVGVIGLDNLQELGLGVMTIGIGHKAIKQS